MNQEPINAFFTEQTRSDELVGAETSYSSSLQRVTDEVVVVTVVVVVLVVDDVVVVLVAVVVVNVDVEVTVVVDVIVEVLVDVEVDVVVNVLVVVEDVEVVVMDTTDQLSALTEIAICGPPVIRPLQV